MTNGTKMPREWHLAYNAEYYRRPDVMARRAEQARERARDPAERHKWLCRWKTQRAIASGKLRRKPCEICGAVKFEAHHEDYSRPLDVRWLCHRHHREHHAKVAP